jgi:hypothetical protein
LLPPTSQFFIFARSSRFTDPNFSRFGAFDKGKRIPKKVIDSFDQNSPALALRILDIAAAVAM